MEHMAKMPKENIFDVSMLKMEYENNLNEFLESFMGQFSENHNDREFWVDSTLPHGFNQCMLSHLEKVLSGIIAYDRDDCLDVTYIKDGNRCNDKRQLKVVLKNIEGKFHFEKFDGMWDVSLNGTNLGTFLLDIHSGYISSPHYPFKLNNLSNIACVEYVFTDDFNWLNFFRGFITHIASSYKNKYNVFKDRNYHRHILTSVYDTTLSISRLYMKKLSVQITLVDSESNRYVISRGMLDENNDGDSGALHLPLYEIIGSINNTLGNIKPWYDRKGKSLCLLPFSQSDVSLVIGCDGRILNDILSNNSLLGGLSMKFLNLCYGKYKILHNNNI